MTWRWPDMANPSKRTGTSWESKVAQILTERRTFGGEVTRAPLWGAEDKGDLVATGDFVFECKATKGIELGTFMNETETERKNAARRWGVCVVKRRNHDANRAYAVMELGALLDLIEQLPLDVRLGVGDPF